MVKSSLAVFIGKNTKIKPFGDYSFGLLIFIVKINLRYVTKNLGVY